MPASCGVFGREDALTNWIHFERFPRYHAVLAILDEGAAVTFCGKVTSVERAHAQTTRPPAKCWRCGARVERPYLIPWRLKQLQ